MRDEVQTVLENFSLEAGALLIATGVVSLDGVLEAYIANAALGSTYNVQRSASTFAMIVNILNAILPDITGKQEDVTEVTVVAEDTCFMVRLGIKERYYHGVTFSVPGEKEQISRLMEHYRPLFTEALT